MHRGYQALKTEKGLEELRGGTVRALNLRMVNPTANYTSLYILYIIQTTPFSRDYK